MSRPEIKARSTYLLYLTRPHPYLISFLFVILLQLISIISLQVGGQPFEMDMTAMAAGDTANAIHFSPENVTLKATGFLLALEIVAAMLRYGFMSFHLHAARRENVSYYDLMDGFMLFFRAAALWLITGIMVYIGLLLLIVPGVYLAITYAMAPRLMFDHSDWGVFRCLAESRRLMTGNRWDFFKLRVSLLGWTILRAFPFTAVFAEPFITMCDSVYYLYLIRDPALEFTESSPPDEKPPWEY